MYNYRGLEQFPFVAEAIAIDIANSLSGAEIGIRGFRNRNFLIRMWDGLTGESDEYIAEIAADSLVAQKAMVEYLKITTTSDIHTQKCLTKVTRNLLKVINDVQLLDIKITAVKQKLESDINALRSELGNKINSIDFTAQRNRELRQMTAQYKAMSLYEGMDNILRSALYIAQVSNLYWGGTSDNIIKKEIDYAKNVVKATLINTPEAIGDLLINSLENSANKLLPVIVYITSQNNSSLLKTYNLLFSRKYAGLPTNLNNIKECLTIAEAVADDNFLQQGEIYTPYQISCELAKQLTNEPINK